MPARPRRVLVGGRSARSPATRESTRIMRRKLPPLFLFVFGFTFGICFALFTPELVAGTVDEHILQRWFAHGNCLNLTRKSLNHVGNEPVSAFSLDTHLA